MLQAHNKQLTVHKISRVDETKKYVNGQRDPPTRRIQQCAILLCFVQIHRKHAHVAPYPTSALITSYSLHTSSRAPVIVDCLQWSQPRPSHFPPRSAAIATTHPWKWVIPACNYIVLLRFQKLKKEKSVANYLEPPCPMRAQLHEPNASVVHAAQNTLPRLTHNPSSMPSSAIPSPTSSHNFPKLKTHHHPVSGIPHHTHTFPHAHTR